MPKRIRLDLTLEQAEALCKANETHLRLSIGQVEYLAELVRFGGIPKFSLGDSSERREASAEECERIEALMHEVKRCLGYPKTGSHGVGHRHVDKEAHRAYEIIKVTQKALLEASKDEVPVSRQRHSVWSDGLLVRYTSDPAPVAVIIDSSDES